MCQILCFEVDFKPLMEDRKPTIQSWKKEKPILHTSTMMFGKCIFFTPSPPVAQTIVQVLNGKGLNPGRYVSAHVRALYGKDFEKPKWIQDMTKTALNCASRLHPPGSPIFLASDSNLAADFGVDYGASQRAKVGTHESHPNPPLHLDSDNHNQTNMIVCHHPVAIMIRLSTCTSFPWVVASLRPKDSMEAGR
jgi:hypothetical protein